MFKVKPSQTTSKTFSDSRQSWGNGILFMGGGNSSTRFLCLFRWQFPREIEEKPKRRDNWMNTFYSATRKIQRNFLIIISKNLKENCTDSGSSMWVSGFVVWDEAFLLRKLYIGDPIQNKLLYWRLTASQDLDFHSQEITWYVSSDSLCGICETLNVFCLKNMTPIGQYNPSYSKKKHKKNWLAIDYEKSICL